MARQSHACPVLAGNSLSLTAQTLRWPKERARTKEEREGWRKSEEKRKKEKEALVRSTQSNILCSCRWTPSLPIEQRKSSLQTYSVLRTPNSYSGYTNIHARSSFEATLVWPGLAHRGVRRLTRGVGKQTGWPNRWSWRYLWSLLCKSACSTMCRNGPFFSLSLPFPSFLFPSSSPPRR